VQLCTMLLIQPWVADTLGISTRDEGWLARQTVTCLANDMSSGELQPC
jgi:hypothetical protein